MTAIGLFGGIGVAVVAVLTLALKALSEAKGRRESAVLAAQEGSKATGLAAQLADMTNRHDKEKQRAESANETIKKLLVEMATAPAAGSFRRLVSIIEAARAAAGGDGDGALHLPTGADGGSDWELLKPGD